MTFIIINIIGAFAAMCVNLWAAQHMSGLLRVMFNVIAGLALIYTVGYLWLAFNPESVASWSIFFRKIGVASWFAAWCAEPFIIIRFFKKEANKILSETVTVLEQYEK